MHRDTMNHSPDSPAPSRGRQQRAACAPPLTLLHMIRIARDRIDDGDLLHREVGDDLDFLLVHDQHFLYAHAIAEALAVLSLERKGHAGLDLDRMIERPDARDHRRIVLREPEPMAP